MPFSVRWQGRSLYRPGVYTFTDVSGLANLDIGTDAAIMVIGEADAGQPQATSSTPVYHKFTSATQMIDTFQTGNLAEVARIAFDPAQDGQTEYGVPIRGCDVVYAVKTNQSGQAEYTLQDGSSNNALKLKDNIWGLQGNQTWFQVDTSGTGIKLTVGRDSAPNVGSQESIDFSITGTDEWLELGVTGAFTGTSCTVTFDGTSLIFNSDVALEDLTVTVTGKTMQAIVQEINAFAPIAGAAYSATVLRTDRSTTLASYLDIVSTPLDIFASDKKMSGVSWDIVAWVNSNSVYCDAEWLGGYEPTTYTLTYLAGGTTGDSTSTTIQEAYKTAKKIGCRFIVSAFTGDIPGPVVLTTINGYLTTHLNQVNPITGRAERQGFMCADSTTKANLWTEIANYNNEFASVVMNEISREGPDDVVAWLGPHCVATAAAAIMAGSPIGTPLTHKYIKAYDMRPVATDFDPEEDTDFQNAIRNGLLFLETDPDEGVRFAKGITTYTTEDNDGFTYLEVVEEKLWLARLLRRNVQKTFIGHKGRGLQTTVSYRRRVLAVLQALSDPTSPDQILVSGTDAQGNDVPPYRNVIVSLSGDQLYLEADLTFAQGINFIFNKFRATLPTALAA